MRISDWSSDVCSSDLGRSGNPGARDHHGTVAAIVSAADAHQCEEIGSGKEAHHQWRGVHEHPHLPFGQVAGELLRKFRVGPRRRYGSKLFRYCCLRADPRKPDRKSVVEGKSVSVSVYLGGRRTIQKKRTYNTD